MTHFAIIGSRGYPSTYGGFETFVRRLAPYLRDEGVDVTVYGRGAKAGIHEIDGIRVVSTVGRDSKSASTLSYGLSAATHARGENYDAALVLNVANGYFLPLLRRAGIPTLVNVDGIEWERDKWSTLGKRVFLRGAKLTARYADELVVDAKAIGAYWEREFGRESTFIPYGGDLTYIESRSKMDEAGLPENYVLAVARMAPENNIGLFLDSIERMPTDVPVVLVGDANYESELRVRARRFQEYRPNFHWLGHVADQGLLAELWAHAGVYFHGHSVGGTNPSLLQAMGYGAPVVAFDTVYSREVLEGAGQLVPNCPDQTAAALLEVRSDAILRKQMKYNGWQRVADAYTWHSVCSSYHQALCRVAATEAPRVVEQQRVVRLPALAIAGVDAAAGERVS